MWILPDQDITEEDRITYEGVNYAIENNIPIDVNLKKSYSIDENLWGRSIECGILEDPWAEPPDDIFIWTKSPNEAPDKADYITIGFDEGIPISIDGQRLSGVALIQQVHEVACKHGVGRIDHMENRVVGIKSREIYEAKIPFKPDIVIAECRPPSDMDMWQAAKAIYAGGALVKQGGTIILLAKCPEGISKEHPEVSKIGYQKLSYVKQLVNNRTLKDLVAAAHIAHVGSIIREKADCILISEGIERERAERIGFKYRETLEEALNEALARHGRHSRIVILHEAQYIFPKIG